MSSIRPSLANDATAEQINAYYAKYRKKNRDRIRAYNRTWMRAKRRQERREALKTKAS